MMVNRDDDAGDEQGKSHAQEQGVQFGAFGQKGREDGFKGIHFC